MNKFVGPTFSSLKVQRDVLMRSEEEHLPSILKIESPANPRTWGLEGLEGLEGWKRVLWGSGRGEV